VVQGNEVKNEDVLQQHKHEDAKSLEELATAIAATHNIIRAGAEEVIPT
jgi:hypothetical protein